MAASDLNPISIEPPTIDSSLTDSTAHVPYSDPNDPSTIFTRNLDKDSAGAIREVDNYVTGSGEMAPVLQNKRAERASRSSLSSVDFLDVHDREALSSTEAGEAELAAAEAEVLQRQTPFSLMLYTATKAQQEWFLMTYENGMQTTTKLNKLIETLKGYQKFSGKVYFHHPTPEQNWNHTLRTYTRSMKYDLSTVSGVPEELIRNTVNTYETNLAMFMELPKPLQEIYNEMAQVFNDPFSQVNSSVGNLMRHRYDSATTVAVLSNIRVQMRNQVALRVDSFNSQTEDYTTEYITALQTRNLYTLLGIDELEKK